MHMGIGQSVQAYWEMETKHSAVCDVMSGDRFLKLLTLIHSQDNLIVSDDVKNENFGNSGHGYKNYANNFFAYLLKNVMLLMKSWCLSSANRIDLFICQQNFTSWGLRCGDMLDKLAFFMTLMLAKRQTIQTKQNL